MAGDPSLTDVELQNEIDLVGALVLAASQNDGPMSQDRIDELLGVDDVAPAGAGDDAPQAARSGDEPAPAPAGAEPRDGTGATP